MPGMRRGDRRNSSDDNARRYPASRQEEPASPHELRQLLKTTRSQRDEYQSKLQEASTQLVHIQHSFQTSQSEISKWQECAMENHQLYLEEHQKLQEASTHLVHIQHSFQASQSEISKWQKCAMENHQLYLEEHQKHQQSLCLYNQEKLRAIELLAKYDEANAQCMQYLTLYNEAQTQLKYERRSKASIKGWETRRKSENQKLKQEISEMTVLLRESLERKDEAVDNLYILAERMDRIQQLVDSVEEESSSTPIGFLQKLKRIWRSIKNILDE
jgi:chromosome segregation ATPase